MVRFADTRDMSHSAWLEARRAGIGGSDAAAILGASPWATPLSVWADKQGLTEEKPDTIAMRFGRDAEEIVARWFAEDTGKTVAHCNAILQHPAHPFMLANIDRQIRGERAGLECKTTSAYNRTDFEGGSIPPYYYWQCMHYLAVTGWERWYLAVLHGNSAFYHFEIPRNEEHVQRLIAAETAFWNEHVLPAVPPAPTGTEADDRALNAMATPQETTTAVLDGIEDVFTELATIKASSKAAERRKAELEQIIKLEMGSATEGSAGAYRIVYKPQERRSLDEKRLALEEPAIYAHYVKTTCSRPLRVMEVKACSNQ